MNPKPVQHVVSGHERSLLFHTWAEAAELWRRLVEAFPGLLALVLMPDHLHLLLAAEATRRLREVGSGYARWRNHRRGVQGPVLAPIPSAEPVADHKHLRRLVRYIHLNPVRRGMVACPLAWPFSTHRDMVGLTLDPVVPRAPDAASFHGYVVTDHEQKWAVTSLPLSKGDARPSLSELHGALSAASRAPWSQVRRDPILRASFVRCARALVHVRDADIARHLSLHRATICRVVGEAPAEVALLRRTLADSRFTPLMDGDLRRTAAFASYRHRR